MSRRTTKQRRAARRRRHWYQLEPLARLCMSALTTPVRQWFTLDEAIEEVGQS